MSILSQLPELLCHQKGCESDKPGCQFNAKLLQYFINKEFLQKPKKASSEVANEASEPVASIENTVESKQVEVLDISDKQASEEQKKEQESENCCHHHEAGHHHEAAEKSSEDDDQRAAVMTITKCPHTSRKHYAKNMCSSCYRKFGRNQNAWKCEHHDRLLYSMGMCQTCYLSDYHKRRTKVKRKVQQQKAKAIKQAAKDQKAVHEHKDQDGQVSCKSVSSESINKINKEITIENTKSAVVEVTDEESKL